MEADWIRLQPLAIASVRNEKSRQWFACEIPNEDEDSEDDDWCHVADVFTTVELGVVTQIEIWLGHEVDEIFEQDARNGRLEEVIVQLLRQICQLPFALDVSLFRATLGKQPAFIYHSDLGVLA